MADVRLTATNPEDSSVVPVACDASGRLLLEEQGQGPPGPQGPPGEDGKDGNPFSGNFADDVTFGGSAEFAGTVTLDGTLKLDGGRAIIRRDGDNPASISNFISQFGPDGGTSNTFQIMGDGTTRIGSAIPTSTGITLNPDGSATFAGGKAGFTAEGHLWCTTRRGDTVILDATSNGLASWVEYTPTTRLEEIRDRLDVNRPDTGEMPADTP